MFDADAGACLDVPVFGVRTGGDHPERHELSPNRFPGRPPDRLCESGAVPDDVVRRQDQQNRVVCAASIERLQGRGGDRRRRVSSHRFEQYRRRRNANRLKLLGNHEAVPFVADHDGGMRYVESLESACGGLQQGVIVQQRDELLGVVFPGQWPEPRPGAARQDNGEHGVGHLGCMFLCRGLAKSQQRGIDPVDAVY